MNRAPNYHSPNVNDAEGKLAKIRPLTTIQQVQNPIIPAQQFPMGYTADKIAWAAMLTVSPHLTETIGDIDKIEDLNVDKIKRANFGVILDVDGTLKAKGCPDFTPEVVEKLKEIQAKIKVCIFPNNGEQYELFRQLRIPIVQHAAPKPYPEGFKRAADYLGKKTENCLMIGDDLLEDGGASRVGMALTLVEPIVGNENIFKRLGRGYGRLVKKIYDSMNSSK